MAVLVPWLAAGQASAVLEDLERRAVAALNSIQRASTSAEAEQQRELLRRKIEDSLGLGRVAQSDPATALLYLPEGLRAPAPAIIMVDPHKDPRNGDSQVFAAALARLGFVVASLDVRSHHTRLDLLPGGVAPQGLLQRGVRAALMLLLNRHDVDAQHIGLVGTGLAGTVAAAINSQFSSVVLTDAAPGLIDQIRRMRALREDDCRTRVARPRVQVITNLEDLVRADW